MSSGDKKGYASRECYDDKMTEEGFDVMRLTVSGEPCDSCSRYENHLFSLTGATAGLPTKADLEAAGVFHPNCTHTYVLVPDYIRLRDYNPDGTKKEKLERQGEVYQFEYPLNGAKMIHNHPSGQTPSWRDFEQFVQGNMREMKTVTQNGIYSLTQDGYGTILNMDETKKPLIA